MTAFILDKDTGNLALYLVHTQLCDKCTQSSVSLALHHICLFVRHVYVVEGQAACGMPSPLQLKPVSCPREQGPGLQDS